MDACNIVNIHGAHVQENGIIRLGDGCYIGRLDGITFEEVEKREKAKSLTSLTFGEALEQIKRGKGMRLPAWQPDVVIRAQYPDEHSKMTAPYLYVESRFGRVPWKETMIELFSEKWEVVE